MATNTTIDTLEVKISANAQAAVNSLKSLSKALQSVKTALTGVNKDGVSASDHIAKSLNEMNGALNTITTSGIKKIQKLANGLNDYADALKRVKALGSVTAVSKSINDTKKALDVPTKDDTTPAPGGSASVPATSDVQDRISWSEKLASALGKVKSAIGKVGKAFQKLREQIHFTSGGLGKLFKALGRIAFYRAIRSAIKAVTEAFSEGLKNAYLYSKQSEGFERLANALDRLKSVTSQMVNQLGAFWGEFRQLIQPAVEWIIEKVRQLTEFLTELFAGLNGADKYEYAVLEELKWDDATDSLKKYKQQLLGLDEINNLSTKDDGKDKDDPLKKFELKPVRESFQQIGQAFQSIKGAIEGAMREIGDLALLPLGMSALGLIFLFTGHPLLGIPLILKGVEWTLEEAKWNNAENTEKIDGFFAEYRDMFKKASNAAIAIGTMLLFVPGQRGLGLGLILGGNILKNMTEGKTKFSWKNFLDGKFDRFLPMFKKGSAIAIAIGAMMLFIPTQRGLGLGLIAGGIALSTIAKQGYDLEWGSLGNTLFEKFDEALKVFEKASCFLAVIGAICLFIPGMEGAGLKLIQAGMPGMFATLATIDWNVLLDNLKIVWANIRVWWNNTVVAGVNKAINWIEEKTNIDFNRDGQIGGLQTENLVSVEDYLVGLGASESRTKNITGDGKEVYRRGITSYSTKHYLPGYEPKDLNIEINPPFSGGNDKSNVSVRLNAMGGINKPGSYFLAGEAGPEFIGRIGNTSAVANTEQMTEAIRKAAYMGVSQALKENGGMNGFEPATTDDLFIAMKKKSSAYTKRTGQPAFG